ncbi:hypothetical protein [Streptomyces sp. YIM 98790]|nr:hypothetical protein [Streptomyces sp. YIM 98790]
MKPVRGIVSAAAALALAAGLALGLAAPAQAAIGTLGYTWSN